MSILFALRIHRRQSSTNIDTLNKLIASLKHSISFITQQKHDTQDIAIAIACDGSDSELKNRIQQEIRITHTIDNPVNSNKLFDNEIITFLVNVSPWSHFVPALNALLLVSADNPIHKRYQFILFQSLEVTLSREMLKNLIEFGNREDSLVCGVGFMDAHESFLDSSTENKIGPISGLTVPWNTCALWNTNKLLTTGFLSISEGLVEVCQGVGPAIEEVAVIALHQKLFPINSKVYLLFPKMSSHSCWNRNWQDSERLKYHNDKMLTKKKRAEQQTVALGLKLDININVVHHYLV